MKNFSAFRLRILQKHACRFNVKDHDKEQAMLKAMELQVENLAEDELKFRTKKEHIERLIGEKQKEIERHKRRAEEMERNYQDAV